MSAIFRWTRSACREYAQFMDDETCASLALAVTCRAKEEFSNHILIKESTDQWLCKNPESSFYHFRVVRLPEAILLYGDIGDLFLRVYEKDPLQWLLGSVGSRDYLLGKCTRPERVFLPAEAEAWLREFAQEDAHGAEEIRTFWDLNNDPDGRSFVDAYQHCTGDSEVPSSCFFWSPQILWQYEALRWFANKLSPADAANAYQI